MAEGDEFLWVLVICGYGLVVECDLPKVETRVRFPVPAPNKAYEIRFLRPLTLVLVCGSIDTDLKTRWF